MDPTLSGFLNDPASRWLDSEEEIKSACGCSDEHAKVALLAIRRRREWEKQQEQESKKSKLSDGHDQLPAAQTTVLAAKTSQTFQSLFQLQEDCWKGSGLEDISPGPLLLFRRQEFNDQFKFMDQGMTDKALCWILGPPGTGKSSTALAFATEINNDDWRVIWVHLYRLGQVGIISFQKGQKYEWPIMNRNKALQVLNSILTVDAADQCAVFLDGYKIAHQQDRDNAKFKDELVSWREANRNAHVLFIISSAVGRVSQPGEDRQFNIREHYVFSWTRAQYEKALENVRFKDYVIQSLDAHVVDLMPTKNSGIDDQVRDQIKSRVVTLQEMVDAKFRIAGISCRYMFNYKAGQVAFDIFDSAAKIGDPLPYLDGRIVDNADSQLSRLFGTINLGQPDILASRKRVFVSEFAASAVAMKAGPETVKNLAQNLFRNFPAMLGNMLEMWFFAKLAHPSGITLKVKGTETTVVWSSQTLVSGFDPSVAVNISPKQETWLRPWQWYHGGFDAVYFNSNTKEVIFVQVTRGQKHSLKLEYFYKVLELFAFGSSPFEISNVEIYFVVSRRNADSFQIPYSEVTGSGLLHPYGFIKTKELDKVKIAIAEDFED